MLIVVLYFVATLIPNRAFVSLYTMGTAPLLEKFTTCFSIRIHSTETKPNPNADTNAAYTTDPTNH